MNVTFTLVQIRKQQVSNVFVRSQGKMRNNRKRFWKKIYKRKKQKFKKKDLKKNLKWLTNKRLYSSNNNNDCEYFEILNFFSDKNDKK